MSKLRKFAPLVLRAGVALVFLWFGYQQITDPGSWAQMIPAWYVKTFDLSAYTLVLINAWFEIIMGVLLLLGFRIKIVALLLALHLFHITYIVGYNGIGVRDFGLAMATLSIFLSE